MTTVVYSALFDFANDIASSGVFNYNIYEQPRVSSLRLLRLIYTYLHETC